jgi:hypothetical protein
MKAFPSAERLSLLRNSQTPAKSAEFIYEESSGMELRDYFAAKALPAILEDYINESRYIGEKLDFCDMYSEERIAQIAYAMADAMLEARVK